MWGSCECSVTLVRVRCIDIYADPLEFRCMKCDQVEIQSYFQAMSRLTGLATTH